MDPRDLEDARRRTPTMGTARYRMTMPSGQICTGIDAQGKQAEYLICAGCGRPTAIDPEKGLHGTVGSHGPHYHQLVPGLGWLCWDCYRLTPDS